MIIVITIKILQSTLVVKKKNQIFYNFLLYRNSVCSPHAVNLWCNIFYHKFLDINYEKLKNELFEKPFNCFH